MRKLLAGLTAGLLIGAVAGFAAGIFAFPYLFPPPPVNEIAAGKTAADAIARGTFAHADPSDPVHYGRGAVTLYPDVVQLEADFEVGPGPKYHVYLVPLADVTPSTAVDQTMFVDLGRLKAFAGSQVYPIPDGLDLREYASLVIWCERFGVLISPAGLTFVAGGP